VYVLAWNIIQKKPFKECVSKFPGSISYKSPPIELISLVENHVFFVVEILRGIVCLAPSIACCFLEAKGANLRRKCRFSFDFRGSIPSKPSI